MDESARHALAELAVVTAIGVERAPGPVERRLVLMQAFGEAHRINPAVTEDPDLRLLDGLLRERHALIPSLEALWMEETG